ncbi:unnamed protein product [Adineta steineri]|uniref:Transposase n=1 Tax=Adineta steineri TaxID=433720 RepID=A0A815T3Y6_9BILA|nr:unnamed protein product [Adineta steineri]CAF4011062.1 unnamed protein product [Adineta steineri]
MNVHFNFRNTVRRWTKYPKQELKYAPENREKFISYYVHMLENYLLPAAKQQFRQNWRLQQDNDPKHTSNISKQFINENVPQLLQ